ncbi:MAG: adenosylcobinamide-GDP ribazoletransferase [Verrucomicrobiota bacterium]
MRNPLKRWTSSLVTAMRTLTALPVPGTDTEDAVEALPWFPVVGALLGGLAFALDWGLRISLGWDDPGMRAFVLVLFGVVATRGLHLDGVADWADGFWGGFARERTLAIMKDHNLGAFGTTALVLVLLGKWAALSACLGAGRPEAVIVAFCLARWAQVDLAVSLPYARAEGGTGLAFIERSRSVHLALAGIVAGILVFLTLPVRPAAVALVAAVASSRLFALWYRRRLGGVTGDLLGNTSEWTEVLVLALLA